MHKVIGAHTLEATPTSSTCTHLGSAMAVEYKIFDHEKGNIVAKDLPCLKVQFLRTCKPLTSHNPNHHITKLFFLLQDAVAKVVESSYQTITKIELLTRVNKLSYTCIYVVNI